MKIVELVCNHAINPIGVESRNPVFSWKTESDSGCFCQIQVADDEKILKEDMANIWNSGKIKISQNIYIGFEGLSLRSRQRYYWRVRVWNGNGDISEWSDIAYFEMGLLSREDWKGSWIAGADGKLGLGQWFPAPHFRKEFMIKKSIRRARAYVCGVGYIELYINGKKVGDEVLSPSFTRYDTAVMYSTYDVTLYLKEGENVIEFVLGNGMYNCFTEDAWSFSQAPWRSLPKGRINLWICHEEGEEELLVTDFSWKTRNGPIVFDGIRHGEYYDARLEIPEWNLPKSIESSWEQAKVVRAPGGVLRSAQLPPIRVIETIAPVSLTEVGLGVWLFDLGKNITGWARIRMSGPEGFTVTLRYGERIHEDGTLDVEHIAKFVTQLDFQTDRYTFKGEGIECWEPRFTYHGFQYIEVTGLIGNADLSMVEGRMVHTDFGIAGEFSCSDEILNKIQECTRLSTRTNFLGMPMDCPHREKNGWTGDAQLSSEQSIYNFDLYTSYEKWLEDVIDAQRPSGELPAIIPTGGWGYGFLNGPAWDGALILIPWNMYLYYGDVTILKRCYIAMKKYITFLEEMSEDFIVSFGLGDWNPPTGGNTGFKCPTAVTDTAYFYQFANILSKIATLLGRTEDYLKYVALAGDIKNSFQNNFISEDTGVMKVVCQTSLVCALYHGLVCKEQMTQFMEALVLEIEKADHHIDCGILGTKYLLEVLSEYGYGDLAYRIVTQTTFPGWGNWIMQGATTLWGNWDGEGSRNHHMFGTVSAWFYKYLAGIQVTEQAPGFRRIMFRPKPPKELKEVSAWHISPYGKIEAAWKQSEDIFEMKVTIPWGCTANFENPFVDSKSIRLDNEKQDVDSIWIYDLGSGEHRIEIIKQAGVIN